MGVYSNYFNENNLMDNFNYISNPYDTIIEIEENAHSIFESILAADFAEASATHGIITESDYQIIQEGVLSNIIDKVIEFFGKILEKISGILGTLASKFKALFSSGKNSTSNNYKIVMSGFKSDAFNESTNIFNEADNEAKFTFKWREVEPYIENFKYIDHTPFFNTEAQFTIHDKGSIYEILKESEKALDRYERDAFNPKEDTSRYWGIRNVALKRDKNTFNEENYKNDILNNLAPFNKKTNAHDFKSDLFEYTFGPEKELTNKDYTTIFVRKAFEFYMNGDKLYDNIMKSKIGIEKSLKNIIEQARIIKKKLKFADEADSVKRQIYKDMINYSTDLVTRMGKVGNECVVIYFSAITRCYKQHEIQCKMVIDKAAAYLLSHPKYKGKFSNSDEFKRDWESRSDLITKEMYEYETDEIMGAY